MALHHVLVKAVGGDGHEYARQKLLPEPLSRLGIVEEKHAAALMAADRVGQLARPEAEIAGDEYDAEHHRAYQTCALEEIGPYKGFHAAPDGIQPYEPDGGGHIDLKRDAERAEDQKLQHGADHEESH